MVCFPQFLARIYSMSIVIDQRYEGYPIYKETKLDCWKFCMSKANCSAFSFKPSGSECYAHTRWMKNLVTTKIPYGYQYSVMYTGACWFEDYQYVRSVGMCLKFSKGIHSFEWAQWECQKEDARLVKLDTEEKQEIVSAILKKDYSGEFWIGVTDFNKDGTWEWTDGDVASYVPWASEEPNSYKTYQCGYKLASTDPWLSCYCSALMYYICEKTIN